MPIPTQKICLLFCLLLSPILAAPAFCQNTLGRPESQTAPSPYAQWKNGPPADADFFPIAVWLQNPRKAPLYKKAGFNTYVGLWKGPTEDQLDQLKRHGMKVICRQNAVGLRHRDDPVIIAWMHGDEPDNAQSLGKGKGYGPPILPEKIVSDYQTWRANDPTRPVLLNLGQGVAWDQYIGRGVRRNHPEDYPEYLKGCDIASFDIYPVVNPRPQISGNLWYVPRGVERLVQWTGGEKPVWNCIECTRISSPDKKPSPRHVRAEVWMSLVHGSRGIIYFVHEWTPRFNESALLDDPEMLAAVTRVNNRIRQLAPVLNTPSIDDAVEIATADPDAPVAAAVKSHGGRLYIFAVSMRDKTTTAAIKLNAAQPYSKAEVLGENRVVPIRNNTLEDTFQPWDVHLYQLEKQTP